MRSATKRNMKAKKSSSKTTPAVSPFADQCYRLLCKVPRGAVTTYADLAHALGTKAYRAVGTAMNRNPFAPQVPCHRVVCSDGSLGGFAHGSARKMELLRAEGVRIKDGQIEQFERRRYTFRTSAR